MTPSVGIVGGGILGMTAAYRLAQAGVAVSLYERAPDLGGLVGSFDFEGTPVDRFYHVVLPTDHRILALAEELGLGDKWRFRPTRVGFYDDGRLFSMTTPKEAATFPLLSPLGRVRLAAFVARCQLGDYEKLDRTPLLDWLRKTNGRQVVRKLWEPLLDSKFDGRYDDLPATYIWSRSRRMSKTRNKGGHEVMGWLEGGYQTLIDALEARIRELGGQVHARTAVDGIISSGGRARAIVVDGTTVPFNHVLCTLTPPQARGLLDEALLEQVPPTPHRYLGVVCLLLRLTRSISPYYHLNLTDRRVPLTTVVETTHVVDPDYVGGHLVYASKYVDPSSPELERPLADVERDYLAHLRTIFPDLRDDEIVSSVVQRARIVESVHTLGGAQNISPLAAAPGLTLASTANVYPEILSGQSVTGIVEQVVPEILGLLPQAQRLAA